MAAFAAGENSDGFMRSVVARPRLISRSHLDRDSTSGAGRHGIRNTFEPNLKVVTL
jgi:hypothetical protein